MVGFFSTSQMHVLPTWASLDSFKFLFCEIINPCYNALSMSVHVHDFRRKIIYLSRDVSRQMNLHEFPNVFPLR